MRSASPRSVAHRLFPFLSWLSRSDRRTVRADFIAGLTGAVIVLPQGVAYALIAGLPPQYGLYTAIVVPIVAALFGSSWHLVSGPTAAISIVVFSVVSGVVAPDSPEFLVTVLTVTFLAGIIQLALGLFRLGTLVNFVSHTVVVGFTTGAAILIATSQLRHLLGLTIDSGQAFVQTLQAVAVAIGDTNYHALAIGLVTLVSAVLIKRWRRSWPNMLLAMMIGTGFAALIGAADHGVRFVGAMPAQLPPLSSPAWSLDLLREIAGGAFAVAIIALIEAVAIARAVAMRSQQRIDGNQEFIGQGLSNIVGSFFSCYAGSGSFTRTGANYDAGARTPLAAIFAALILAVILLVGPWLTAYLPMAAMAGIVMLIAWNLLDPGFLKHIVRSSRNETLILLATLASTLLLKLEFAIYAGVVLSLVLYIQRSARPRLVPLAPVLERPGHPLRNAGKHHLPECPDLKILRIDGSLFFGSINPVQDALARLRGEGHRHVLLVGSGVDLVDIAAVEMLSQEADRFRAAGGRLYLSNFKDTAGALIKLPGIRQHFGDDALYSSVTDAIPAILDRIGHGSDHRCNLRDYDPGQGPGPASETAAVIDTGDSGKR